MNPDVKAKWLTALRSGEYSQTKGYLHNAEGYCCLGVLCDIAVKDGVIESSTSDAENYAEGVRIYDGRAELPTDTVAAWAGFGINEFGLRELSPTVTAYHPEDGSESAITLSELNDTWGASFETIADLVEEQL